MQAEERAKFQTMKEGEPKMSDTSILRANIRIGTAYQQHTDPLKRLTIKSQVKKEEVTNELRKRISEMVVP